MLTPVPLTSEDLNYNREPACGARYRNSSEGSTCQRRKGHRGDHAAYFMRNTVSFYYVWCFEEGEAIPHTPQWLERECGECGIPLVDTHQEEAYCFSCKCWLMICSSVEVGEERFVIHGGDCYFLCLPERGTATAVLKRATGVEEEVGLLYRGVVPSHLRYRLPDTPQLLLSS